MSTKRYAQKAFPLELQEGVPYTLTITFPLEGAVPADTYTSSLVIARDGVSLVSTAPVVVAGTDEVTITLALSAAQTAGIETRDAIHRLNLLEAGVVIARVFSGPVVVEPDPVTG